MNLENIPSFSKEELIRIISSEIVRSINNKYIRPTFIYSNNVSSLLEIALLATEKLKKYDVYFQPNLFFPGELEIDEFFTFENHKQMFENYSDFFDKYNVNHINKLKKRLYNYSKNQKEVNFDEFPNDLNMIIVFENVNFWDYKSQNFIAKLSENYPNIIVIGQLRSDFDFVFNHVSNNIKSGVGGSTIVALDE